MLDKQKFDEIMGDRSLSIQERFDKLDLEELKSDFSYGLDPVCQMEELEEDEDLEEILTPAKEEPEENWWETEEAKVIDEMHRDAMGNYDCWEGDEYYQKVKAAGFPFGEDRNPGWWWKLEYDWC